MASFSVCSRALVVSKPKEAILNGIQKSVSRYCINPLLLRNVPSRLNHEQVAIGGNWSSTSTALTTTSVTGSIVSLLDRIISYYHSSINYSRYKSCHSVPVGSNYQVGSSFMVVVPQMGYYYSPSHEIFRDVKALDDYSDFIWLSSTLKKRRSKMNKHKLKKRRKKLRLQSKK